MRKGYEAEIKESERDGYLEAQARKISRNYGIDPDDAKNMLCVMWAWNPKKYTGREIRD